MLQLAHVAGVAARALVNQHLAHRPTLVVAIAAQLMRELHALNNYAHMSLGKRTSRVWLSKDAGRLGEWQLEGPERREARFL